MAVNDPQTDKPALTIYTQKDGLRFAAEILLLRGFEKERLVSERITDQEEEDLFSERKQN